MTLKEYLDHLNKMVKKHPEYLNLEVVYAEDDEGNAYYPVDYKPVAGVYYPEDNYFETCKYDEDYNEIELDEKDINAICIN